MRNILNFCTVLQFMLVIFHYALVFKCDFKRILKYPYSIEYKLFCCRNSFSSNTYVFLYLSVIIIITELSIERYM